MEDSNLLASVALFSELYNSSNSDVTEVIIEFIKGLVSLERKIKTNSKELTDDLNKYYGFDLPEPIIRYILKSRLRKYYDIDKGEIIFKPEFYENSGELVNNLKELETRHNEILNHLIDYIETKINSKLSNDDKDIVYTSLKNYLLENFSNDSIYSKYILSFILKNKNSTFFQENLNLIKEGAILHQGIRYTADIQKLGKWTTPLTIYLSIEHLFNAVGYNGLVYKQVFDDFNQLVVTINQTSESTLIILKYLEETKNEINIFFDVAKNIVSGKDKLNLSKPAMAAIVNGCRYPIDLINKKVSFFSSLDKLKIVEENFGNKNFYAFKDYIVDTNFHSEKIREEVELKGFSFNEKDCLDILKIYTKINYLRRGKNNISLENMGYLYLTEDKFALFIANNKHVKDDIKKIEFAKDIDFLTSTFWFKLKKGFSNKNSIPRAFDVITKTQIILSKQVNQNVSSKFFEIKKEFQDGKLTPNEALDRIYYIKDMPQLPENLEGEVLEDAISFMMDETYFEDLKRERASERIELQNSKQQNKELIAKIEKYNQKEEEKRLLRLEEEKKEYQQRRWKEYKKSKNKELIYFFLILAVTFIPKGIEIFKSCFTENKSHSYPSTLFVILNTLVWFSTLFIVIELFLRSYISDKAKVLAGYKWLFIIISKSKMNSLKTKQFVQYELDFSNES